MPPAQLPQAEKLHHSTNTPPRLRLIKIRFYTNTATVAAHIRKIGK
nr:MAG TPA: hypothetical protein [Caudoviricetes sp.]